MKHVKCGQSLSKGETRISEGKMSLLARINILVWSIIISVIAISEGLKR